MIFMLGRLGLALRFAGDHSRAACVLGAFESLEPEVLGAAGRGIRSPELAAALSDCNTDASASRAAGERMSYGQALEYALASPARNDV